MEELIKIASNGQWSLEKSKDSDDHAKARKMIEEFMARKKAKEAQRLNPPAPVSPYPQGMRPVQVSTMNHRPSNPENAPTEGERKWNRAQADAAHRAEEPQVISRQNITAEQLQPRAPETPKNAKMVALDPNKSSGPVVERRPTLGKQPTVEQLPPMSPVTDEKTGETKMQVRQGQFHGEGATTRGKIVDRTIAFHNKKTDERGSKKVPQLEQHHWAWDHNNKKWNHIGTTYTTANEDSGESNRPDLSLSRPKHTDVLRDEFKRRARGFTMDDDEE